MKEDKGNAKRLPHVPPQDENNHLNAASHPLDQMTHSLFGGRGGGGREETCQGGEHGEHIQS